MNVDTEECKFQKLVSILISTFTFDVQGSQLGSDDRLIVYAAKTKTNYIRSNRIIGQKIFPKGWIKSVFFIIILNMYVARFHMEDGRDGMGLQHKRQLRLTQMVFERKNLSTWIKVAWFLTF